MNKGDSDLMAHSLEKAGLRRASGEETADIVVFNTCSVRAHAEERALARIRSARSKGQALIVVTGCMAQRLGKRLLAQGYADLVVGPYQSPRLGEILSSGGGARAYLSQDHRDFAPRTDEAAAGRRDELPFHKWVTITHGCENYCSYCIVPYVRGRLISFPSEAILRHIRQCVEGGATEITLLGQNVNQYGMDSGDIPFHRLLALAAETPGLLRVNFLTSHPMDFRDDIVRVIADHGNISRSVHLPLQSGSDRVLALMNRKYTLERYASIIAHLERTLPDHAVSTDLIVGFPGETEDDYELTLEAVRRFRFDEAFMYAYSPREGTPSFAMEEGIGRERKLERLQNLIDLQRAISREKLLARVDRAEEIIVEGPSKKSPDEYRGRTYLNHPAVLPAGPADVGRKVSVIIKKLRGSTLYGERSA
ncbi:MAG: (Dimethylallyl)adenosine tRNA methylthiotransferase MiaB [Spirochaetes bacterium ADurb.BinA120]|jgi:tRNA-2-methylthio-N6-dimethylallyladenosine synthase|nr:MAG: (Dimethylallyl)adenosine tRNA methylthiotransferase MiaB [Spirochaetes bacterium ADurb.BinA120]